MGFIFGRVSVEDLQLILDPSSQIPDLQEINKRRNEDGTVDLNKIWFDTFVGEKFVLIESAKMVMERSRVDGRMEMGNYG